MENMQVGSLAKVRMFQRATFWLFLVLGCVYIALEIARTNGFFTLEAELLQKSLDLPFAFAALSYGLASVRMAFGKSVSENFTLILFGAGVVVMGVLIYANFLLSDI